ncbi:MAG: peptidyl-alpha-hydroxyglycine alpha-amidating lyase family protein [Chitinophagaceae bacterium]
MKAFFGVIIILSLFSCNNTKKTKAGNPGQITYELVATWPDLSKGYELSQPTGIGIDQDDHIFIFHRTGRKWTEPFPDSLISQNTILELDNESGKIIHSWGANYFIMPHGLTVDKANNIWLTDVGLHQIFKFSHEGKLLLKLGFAKVPGNDSSHFNLPTDIAVAGDGTFYVSDGYGNSRVVKFSATGKYIKAWGTYGKNPGQFIIPHGITIDENNIIYVADRQNNRVQLFDTAGNFIRELKNDINVEQLPSITVDNANHLFAIDYDPTKGEDSSVKGSTIFEFDSSSHSKTRFGALASAIRTSCWFHDIAIDKKGNIYVGDIIGLKVLKFKLKRSI